MVQLVDMCRWYVSSGGACFLFLVVLRAFKFHPFSDAGYNQESQHYCIPSLPVHGLYMWGVENNLCLTSPTFSA